jgi:hypothetical protein
MIIDINDISLIDYQVDSIDKRHVYESVIMRCISCGNVVMLGEVLKNENLKVFNKLLKIDNTLKRMLIDSAIKGSNIEIVKMVFDLFEIRYFSKYEELIKNGDLVYNDYELINKKTDIDYIMDNFEMLTGEPLLVYDECVEAMEKYMNEKLSDENKQLLNEMVSRIQEQMYNVRQEMAEMDNRMYEAWYNWRIDANYHSYDSYCIEEQIDMWDDFKEYYETIELDDEVDSESESQYEQQFEEDYDY